MFRKLSRNDRILPHVNRDGVGLEIGPSFSPIAPKSEGYNVHIIDHLERELLVKKYKPHGLPVENIEEVDFIWRGESYAELVGNVNYYDWIIASHVIEHTSDFVTFLNNCAEVLNAHGVLSLVVPDARYCFDRLRPLTGISKIIDAHLGMARIHSAGTAVEHVFSACSISGEATWKYGRANQAFALTPSQSEVKKIMETYSTNNVYADFHAWCFTPHSFRLLIHDLNALGPISLQEISFVPTRGYEFFITLGKKGAGSSVSRIKLFKEIRAEMNVDTTLIDLLGYKIHRWLTHTRHKFIS